MENANDLLLKASNLQFQLKKPEEAYLTYKKILIDFPDYEKKDIVKMMMTRLENEGLHFDEEKLASMTEEQRTLISNQLKEVQQKYEEKNRISALKESMILSSCSSVDGYIAVQQFGLVFGESVFKTGFLKSLSAAWDNLGDIFSAGDKELSGSMRLLENARNYAINKMIEDAAKRGANAVIGIDSESALGGDVMHITIYGTAVFLEKQDEED